MQSLCTRRFVYLIDIIKPHLFLLKHEFYASRWPVSVLAYVDIGEPRPIAVFLVVIFSVHHEHNIGILLNGPGFAEVGKLRDVARTVLHSARELRESEDGHMELPAELL